jgi:hypothetical protein
VEAGIAGEAACGFDVTIGGTGGVIAGRGTLAGAVRTGADCSGGGTGVPGLATVFSRAAGGIWGEAAASVVPHCTQNFAPG